MALSQRHCSAERHKRRLGFTARISSGIAGRIFADLTSFVLDPRYFHFAIIAAQVLEGTNRNQNQDLC